MIDRYSRKEMKEIWTDQNRFQAFLDVEIANCVALAKHNIISDSELKLIKEKASFPSQGLTNSKHRPNMM